MPRPGVERDDSHLGNGALIAIETVGRQTHVKGRIENDSRAVGIDARLGNEFVSDASNAFEMNRIFGIDFEIFAEAHDKIVHGAGRHAADVAPADFKDFLA